MRIGNDPTVRVKLFTDNYEGYSYYFQKFRNDRDTRISFRVVVSNLWNALEVSLARKDSARVYDGARRVVDAETYLYPYRHTYVNQQVVFIVINHNK